MTIAVYGGQKGGSGKTTNLVNHAVLLQERDGGDILLVDTDIQGSTQDFVATRNENTSVEPLDCVHLDGKDIANQLRSLRSRYRHILVDCVGANSIEMRFSMTVADIMITPCRPARFDSNTMVNVNQTIEDTRIINPALRAFAVINYASPKMDPMYQKREQRLREFLAEYCPNYELVKALAATRIKHYDCADYGLAVHELPDPDLKANAEIRAIFEEIWDGR